MRGVCVLPRGRLRDGGQARLLAHQRRHRGQGWAGGGLTAEQPRTLSKEQVRKRVRVRVERGERMKKRERKDG